MHRDSTTGRFIDDPSPHLQTCRQCGAVFHASPSQIRYGGGKFCSATCRDNARRLQVERICATCGKTFRVHLSDLPRRAAIYCGMDCAQARHEQRVTPLADRFWAQVQKTETCWLWTGPHDGRGYGHIGGGRRNGRALKAPRVAWELVIGPIPEGLWVLHHCDNPPCVRADTDPLRSHLFLGTHADNVADMLAKGRGSRGEQRPGAKLTDTTVRAMRIAADGGETMRSVARHFRVAPETARDAIQGRTWKHVK